MMPISSIAVLSGLASWPGAPPWCVDWPTFAVFCVFDRPNQAESNRQTESFPAVANVNAGLHSVPTRLFVIQLPYRSPRLSTSV